MDLKKIISSDDHMDLPGLPQDLWRVRLPASLKERAPKVETTAEGVFWTCDGQRWGPAGPGRNPNMPGLFEGMGMADGHGRPADPRTRLEDMDRDGVYAHVIYGPPRGFPTPDLLFKYECIKAYNDWTAEFDATAPNRLCNLALLPNHSPQAAADEFRRAAKNGHRGGLLDHFSAQSKIWDPAWEPLWQAAEETGLSVSVHLVGGTYSLLARQGSWQMPAFVSVVPAQLDEVISSMCFCGALERRPNLKLVMGESGLGWVPYVIERMDHEYKKYFNTMKDYRGKLLPSEVFHRQIFVTFEEDELGVKLIPLIGAENVMWASDYPHPDSTWPKSREYLQRAFKDLPASVSQKVLWENAAKLYRLA